MFWNTINWILSYGSLGFLSVDQSWKGNILDWYFLDDPQKEYVVLKDGGNLVIASFYTRQNSF